MVSVVMPSHNTARYIAASIESVLAQTYEDWELLIVDDCSTDNTDEIVHPYLCDHRIRYIKNETNSGAAVTRNRALREASGQWIAFLDSDDTWHPEKLEKQLRFMLDHHYAFTYTTYSEMNEDSTPNGVRVRGPKKITRTGMYRYCWPGCLTVMYSAAVVGVIQVEDLRRNNDYAMWLKICRKADCYLFDEDLAFYRKRADSISRRRYCTLIRWHYKLFRIAEHKGVIASLALTARNMLFGMYKKVKYVRKTR